MTVYYVHIITVHTLMAVFTGIYPVVDRICFYMDNPVWVGNIRRKEDKLKLQALPLDGQEWD
jgi:hypothetical protein